MSPAVASVSLDLDNQWAYLKTQGLDGWQDFPSYLDLVTPRDETRRGGSVMIRLPDRLPAPAVLALTLVAAVAAAWFGLRKPF